MAIARLLIAGGSAGGPSRFAAAVTALASRIARLRPWRKRPENFLRLLALQYRASYARPQ